MNHESLHPILQFQQQKIFFSAPENCAFCKNRDFAWQRWYAVCADRSVQPVIDGNCHFLLLFLSGEITMFQLVSSLPSLLRFYPHIDEITHTACIIFLNMCKMEKRPLLKHDSMIPADEENSWLCFLIIVSSSLHSALASVKCSGHQWLLSGLITIWKTGKIQ